MCVRVCVRGVGGCPVGGGRQVRERKAEEDVLERAGDALLNLPAFIEYKVAHVG